MKQWVLTKFGAARSVFQLKESETPTPGPGQVLIKVSHSGINFADIVARNGLYDEAPKPPCVIGYDVSGTVQAVGEGVIDLVEGSRVFALTRFCGYASNVVVPRSSVAAVPVNVNMEEATALATQACTAYHCSMELTQLHPGDVVLVQAAAGGVGSMIVQMAKQCGCFVYGTASSSKQSFLKELGVDHAIDYTREDFAKVIQAGPHKKVDVVFDNLGGREFKKAMSLIGPCGKMICYGATEQIKAATNKLNLLSLAYGFGLFSPIPMLMQSRSILMVNMLVLADNKPGLFQHHLEAVASLAANGKIVPHVSKVFPFTDIALAHEFVESRQSTGKVALHWME
jgi:NADPH2:quinone reductase